MQLGPHILLEAGGRLLDPAELLRRLRRQQGLVPKGTKSSAIVQLGTAVMAAQSAWPGALWHAWEWRVGGCGRAQGQGLGGRHADRPLRCQHGRRWSQSGRGWQGYMLRHLRDC